MESDGILYLENIMEYAVHLYTQVRLKITGISAQTMALAMAQSEEVVDLHDLLDIKTTTKLPSGHTIEYVEWAEGAPDCFLVDPLKQDKTVDYAGSGWFGPDKLPLVGGQTSTERKAQNAAQALKLMQEVLNSVETLTEVVNEYGVATLIDLLYLQQAILEDGFIAAEHSTVNEFVAKLPSAPEWGAYIIPD